MSLDKSIDAIWKALEAGNHKPDKEQVVRLAAGDLGALAGAVLPGDAIAAVLGKAVVGLRADAIVYPRVDDVLHTLALPRSALPPEVRTPAPPAEPVA